jgi:hypothetical protein
MTIKIGVIGAGGMLQYHALVFGLQERKFLLYAI